MRPKKAPARSIDWHQLLVDAIVKPGIISRAYSLFWSYSIGNQIAALIQCMVRRMEPGPIHTYPGWQQLGRQVKRGEIALVLTMPVTVKSHRQPSTKAAKDDDTDRATIFVERPFWFTLCQTEGADYKPLAIPAWNEQRALDALAIARVPFHHMDGNCQGYARDKEVSVSPIAFLPHRTLFHELAHVLIGHTAEIKHLLDGGETTPRDLREVEAECVAMLCCTSLGLPGEEFSRGYIQHWWHRRQAVPERSVQKIFKAADAILRAGREQLPTTASPPS